MLRFLLDESLCCAKAPSQKPYAMAIGVFDGMHKGHKKIISTLTSKAKDLNYTPCVFTFDRNPKDLFYTLNQKSIQTQEERLSELERMGVECVFQIQFTQKVKAITGAEFMSKICKNFPVKILVCGKDFSIGCPPGKFGIKEASSFLDDVVVVDDVCIGKNRISSTQIRNAIEKSGSLTDEIIKTYF